ncbi:hypothetical protein TUM19329_20240 [Legionella antarctica]|uniref:Ras-GEF domain-containing protein n=1 Tax=Legionella antarctica TaxID=2708020 RepID=A0A6F8T628_9GAMM|nr:RasGEF domain-containing protein [Legionella antarctica]BCA95663.1 hypothetical protein TUM19329_20240 [Legionella antarctica]
MANAKNWFINWYKSNKLFLREPLASQEWDKRISDPLSQKALQTSESVQKIYRATEALLVHDYADLVDGQLRKVIRTLKSKNFSDPSGFSDLKKASQPLKNFFACRDILEKFISDDICGHSKREAQLQAFRRWVGIADLLLKKHHNYEANSLVIMRLLQVDSELRLSNELPKNTKKDYNQLCSLLFPSQNFKVLRSHIQENLHPKSFPPVFLLAKDMTSLNEVIGEKHRFSKSKDLNPSDNSYDNVVLKEQMLEKFILTKMQTRKKLKPHLTSTFNLLTEQYNAQLTPIKSASIRPRSHSAQAEFPKQKPKATDQRAGYKRQPSKSIDAGNTSPIPTQAGPIQPTELYTKRLLPSFWKRKCNEDSYWEKLHEVDPLHRPTIKHIK